MVVGVVGSSGEDCDRFEEMKSSTVFVRGNNHSTKTVLTKKEEMSKKKKIEAGKVPETRESLIYPIR